MSSSPTTDSEKECKSCKYGCSITGGGYIHSSCPCSCHETLKPEKWTDWEEKRKEILEKIKTVKPLLLPNPKFNDKKKVLHYVELDDVISIIESYD